MCRFEETYLHDEVHLKSGSVFLPHAVPNFRDLLEQHHEGPATKAVKHQVELQEPHREFDVDEKGCALGTGKRKECRARVWLSHGQGDAIVNGLPFGKYFKQPAHRAIAMAPMLMMSEPKGFTTRVLVNGGGVFPHPRLAGRPVLNI